MLRATLTTRSSIWLGKGPQKKKALAFGHLLKRALGPLGMSEPLSLANHGAIGTLWADSMRVVSRTSLSVLL